ncbi:MAG TPA: PTS sugar transporter subunit IIA [Phycisphaerae bacterium]|nr:PTS sugar transporter subunit IIA [Phycisphaerae bacterium]
MKLTDHLTAALIKVPLSAADKTQAITELVDLLTAQGCTRARDRLLAAVLQREAQRSTGIGRGFAIPHAKCDAVDRLVIAFGRAPRPLDFDAFDGQSVTLIALLASPPNATSVHIQALARLSRLVTTGTVMDALLAAKTADEFYTIVAENDID